MTGSKRRPLRSDGYAMYRQLEELPPDWRISSHSALDEKTPAEYRSHQHHIKVTLRVKSGWHVEAPEPWAPRHTSVPGLDLLVTDPWEGMWKADEIYRKTKELLKNS